MAQEINPRHPVDFKQRYLSFRRDLELAQALTSQGFGAYSYDGNVRRFIMVGGNENAKAYDLITRDLATKGWLVPGSRRKIGAQVQFPETGEFQELVKQGLQTVQPRPESDLNKISKRAFRRLNQDDR